jgi:hypothetical protein
MLPAQPIVSGNCLLLLLDSVSKDFLSPAATAQRQGRQMDALRRIACRMLLECGLQLSCLTPGLSGKRRVFRFRMDTNECPHELTVLQRGDPIMEEKKKAEFNQKIDRRIKKCQKAPEWAEHARFEEHDEPCEDGRAGVICGNREGEPPCIL